MSAQFTDAGLGYCLNALLSYVPSGDAEAASIHLFTNQPSLSYQSQLGDMTEVTGDTGYAAQPSNQPASVVNSDEAVSSKNYVFNFNGDSSQEMTVYGYFILAGDGETVICAEMLQNAFAVVQGSPSELVLTIQWSAGAS